MIFVVLPEVEMLDLAGPLQAFSEANAARPRYRIRACATRPRIASHQGIVLSDLEPLPDRAGDALVIVPGMPYAAAQKIERKVTRWIAEAARRGAHIASVCTGAFAIGEAGLLDGRRCTTHWSRTGELARRFPRARVLEDRLFVTDGNVTTSAGIASGIDMALALIEQADGPIVAAEVAREMVVYLRRDGAQQQHSVYLDYRTHLHPGVHRVQDWIVRNPNERATLEAIADIAGMSPRTLTRTFRRATGISVLDFTTRVRLELARTLLHDPGLTMEAVAGRVGMSARQLRRFGVRQLRCRV
ncbi:MAG TPA: DJ-1/PfpI family protein [Thermoanaerobaculia bacterium]|nr:DJ-1/PfpI family protein [Thermoanaerobaculia bacterium]